MASEDPAQPAGEPRRRSEKGLAFSLMAAPALVFVNSIAKLDVRGGEKLPKTGAFVLTPNHYSNFDPVIVGGSVWKLGRAPRFLAKASLFRIPVLGGALRLIKQVPVERTGRTSAGSALGAAHDLASTGEGIIVYPEGTLTREPGLWPMRGKSGAVRIALENGVPIIPMAHWGTQAILPRYSKRLSVFPRKTVLIAYGEPVDLDRFRSVPLTQSALSEATELVMQAITALLEDLRGEKAPAERWNPAAHNQTEFGAL